MSEQNIRSIVVDFTTDLTTVFPEYAFLWQRWLTADDAEYEKLNEHFLSVFPERFFDITNSNAEIFAVESTVNTMFLPDVDFKLLFNCAGVSENTKTSMWKYLQLLLFTVIGSVKDSSNFGDAMKMFESMDENDLQSKMQETMDGLGDFFKGFATEGTNDGSEEGAANEEGPQEEGANEGTESKGFKLPKPEVLHEHMRTLMEGKLGKLAKELTEEFTEDLKGVFDETDQNMSMKDIMAQIMKDPKKIMQIMKKITDKLQNKMKNGDISQDELMKEVAGLVEKFKGMGGGGDDFVKNFASGPFAKMFKNMAGQAMGNQAMGNQNLSKHSAMKDRLRKKMEDKKQKQATASASVEPSLPLRPSSIVVKIGDEKQEKSGLAPPPAALSEEELVALFKTRNKKGKKTKNL
jgi:hypothetical protein